MNLRRLRQLIVPVVLCAAHALVPLPAAGQSGAGVDDPQQVAEALARTLAEDLVNAMRRHPILGQRVALQPLDPGEFDHLDLGRGGLQRLYALLVESLGSQVQQSYTWVDPSRFEVISRLLEGRDDPDWFDRYMEILRDSESPISISCTASAARQGVFRLTCSADSVTPVLKNLGTASGDFSKSWAGGPVDPGSAIAYVAEDIVRYMQVESVPGEVSVVDSEARSETVLTRHIAGLLEDKINAIRRAAPRVIGGEAEPSSYRVKGTIARHPDELVLRVGLYSGSGGSPVTTFRESMHWTRKLRKIAGAPGEPPGPEPPGPGGGCEAGADPGQRMVIDQFGSPIKLANWALLTEHRLNTGSYAYFLEVLVRAQTYLADHCNWDRVARILDVATAGLAEELGARIERDPDGGLEELLRVEASAGKHLALMRLRVRAYEMLGVLEEQDRAYTEMLAIAPDDRAVLLPILQAQARIRAEIGAKDGELALGLAGPQRSLVRQGLASFGFDGGEGPGGFDASFREVLRSWQASQGDPATGYLTREQAQALMNAGRAAEEREEDDAAFAQAKAADTEASYEAYLSEHPTGRHVAQVRRLLEAVRTRADDAAFARARASDTEASYEAYLSEHPTGRHVAQARHLLEAVRTRADDAAFARARAVDTEASYAAYLTQYRDGRHASEARRLGEAARVREAAAAAEEALGLSWDERGLVERGLSSWRSGGGSVDGRFDTAFRDALRSWQASQGDPATGYLTREQAQALMDRARAAEEREEDDAAFARAKRADTEASYEAYLSEHPTGRHVAQARRLLEAVRTRADDAAFARARAADTEASYAAYLTQYRDGRHASEARRLGEAARVREAAAATEEALGLSRDERERVERGLSSWRSGGGGSVDGRFDDAFREVLRSWQASQGDPATGYLTREQAQALMGRAREEDDAAFARAKRADTEASYEAYLSEHPTGRHVAQARRRLEAVGTRADDAAFARARAADTEASYAAYLTQYRDGRHASEARRLGEAARVREAAAAERRLGLTLSQRNRIQRALNALGFDVGMVDGAFGPRTRGALDSWQESSGYAATGYLTREQAQALMAEVSELEPGHRFRDCEECPELVVVASGSYRMGSPSGEAGRDGDEGPVHRVSIGEALAVGVYEVTVGQWRRFVGETGYSAGDGCRVYEEEQGEWKWRWRSGLNWERPGFVQGEGHPVVCVSWEDAQAYVSWLSGKTGKGYRLLSESEWEYVARGGKRSARYWGEGERGQCRNANGADESLKRRYSDWRWRVASCDDGYVQTSPVGSFEANGYGMHDVLGNVWEWVEDCWNESYEGAPGDGSAWTRGNCERRVLRGGSWLVDPRGLRSAIRIRSTTGYRSIGVGFRIVRTL